MLWNICQSVVEPVGVSHIQAQEATSTSDTSGSGSGSGSGSSALSKTVWLEDGRKVLVGDSR
jgi:hypothetical protein